MPATLTLPVRPSTTFRVVLCSAVLSCSNLLPCAQGGIQPLLPGVLSLTARS